LVRLPSGVQTFGCREDKFCFDNERPTHEVFLAPARIARGLVTNAQWMEFMGDGGYASPDLWLSDGWATV
jgi:formylglycine-generating enzyme required for sulfatase activity